MNRKELKTAFDEGIIDIETYKDELFKIENAPAKVKKAKRIYDPVKEEEFIKLLGKTRKEVHKIAFMLAFGSGLRISEIVGKKRKDEEEIPALTRECVDLKLRKIIIRSGKGKKDRVTITPKWLKEKHLRLLPIKIGSRTLEASFNRISSKAGINSKIHSYTKVKKDGTLQVIPLYRLRFHSLRGGFATKLLKDGVPVNIVQAFMGHEDLSTTTRYTKVGGEDAIAQAIEAGY